MFLLTIFFAQSNYWCSWVCKIIYWVGTSNGRECLRTADAISLCQMEQELLKNYNFEFAPIYRQRSTSEATEWKHSQVFGGQSTEFENFYDNNETANTITSLRFDCTGEYLAVGYSNGQVIVLKQQPGAHIYQLYTKFKSHDVEFDFLTSVEIEEKVNAIRWYPFPHRNMQTLLTTNDKTIKLFKMSENTAGFGEKKKTKIIVKPDKVYENGHIYSINSISFSSDGETFISSDDLRVNLWNINVSDEVLNMVDIRPETDDLNEIITCSDFHPQNSSIFVYSSSKGYLRLGDLRKSSVCENGTRIFRSNSYGSGGSSFEDLLSSVSHVEFSPCGRMLASREFLSVKIWDLRHESGPLTVKEFDSKNYVICNLSKLYETEAIFDKFQVSWSNDSSRILTGSYNGEFFVIDVFGDSVDSFQVSSKDFEQSTLQMNMNPATENLKVLHTAWNPEASLFVLSANDFGYFYHKNI